MSGVVIKANGQRTGSVRAFVSTEMSVVRVEESGHQEIRQCCDAHSRVAELVEKVALQDTQIASHQQALAVAFEEGKSEGRAAAEDEFDDNRNAALGKLAYGISEAHKRLTNALSSFEETALSLAIEMVDKLAGEPTFYRDALIQAIESRVRDLGEAAILSIAVSRADFPDTSEVAPLSVAREKIIVQEELDAGECKIDLLLGGMEFSLPQQWQDMKARLSEMLLSPIPS